MESTPFNAYYLLTHLHSINRWLVLIFLLWAIFTAFSQRQQKDGYQGSSVLPKGALPAFITTHIQFLLGLVLYIGGISKWGGIGSPYVVMSKEAWEGPTGELYRFYSVTHFSWMLPAILLITVGYMVAKRSNSSSRAANWILFSYLLALIMILVGIPWPGQGLEGGWW